MPDPIGREASSLEPPRSIKTNAVTHLTPVACDKRTKETSSAPRRGHLSLKLPPPRRGGTEAQGPTHSSRLSPAPGKLDPDPCRQAVVKSSPSIHPRRLVPRASAGSERAQQLPPAAPAPLLALR